MIRDRPNSGKRMVMTEELQKIDYKLSVIYEDILENKGVSFYRDKIGMVELGERPPGMSILERPLSA